MGRVEQFPSAIPIITCAWCGKRIMPNAARMRLWLAHFHPECGDELLDYLEDKPAGRALLASNAKDSA